MKKYLKTFKYESKTFKFNKDVNILIGLNGSDKTQLLNSIKSRYLKNKNKYKYDLILFSDTEIPFYRSSLIVCVGEIISKCTKDIMLDNILKDFLNITLQDIETNLKLLDNLSLGQLKYLTLIFVAYLSTFKNKDTTILIDDLGNSIHIRYQYHILKNMLKLNPNLQIICSTHSPSVIGSEWIDNIIDMSEKIIK